MRYVIVASLFLLGTIAGSAYAQQTVLLFVPTQEPAFNLKPVLSYEDAIACGKVGGRGAFVFTLDETGTPTSEEMPYCVTEAK